LLDLASALIDRKTAPFDPQEFHDRYVDALKDLVARKRKAHGEKIIDEKDAGTGRSGSNVVDLMAALKKSMEKGGAANDTDPPAAKKAPARKSPAKKPAAKAAPDPVKKPARKRA
jgi:DNA end-binding protein Ku